MMPDTRFSQRFQGKEAAFTCDVCHKSYSSKSNLKQHKKAKHSSENYACATCSKLFGFASNRNRHQRTCQGNDHVCPHCQKRCSTAHGLRRHQQQVHDTALPPKAKKQPPAVTAKKAPSSQKTNRTVSGNRVKPGQYRCRRCCEVFQNRRDHYLHGMREHYSQAGGGALQPRPWGPGEAAPYDGDQAMREVYDANAPLILESHRIGPMHSVFNYPLNNDVNLNQLVGFAQDIYRRQQRAFRLNVVFGTILQHRETGRYRYFVAYNNNGIFERPLYVSRWSDLQRFRRELERKDILQELLRQRPDTKWIPVLVTNVHFVVFETFYPLGRGDLPDFLMNKRSLHPLLINQQNRKPYDDNLCAFRCLALHRGHDIKSLEGPAKQFLRQWVEEGIDDFQGVSYDEFPRFEETFDVNVELYSLHEDGFACSIYKSRGQHPTTMYLNLYEHHLSYIRNFSQYAQKYQCNTCERHFQQACHLNSHQKSCSSKTKFVYPGGFHRTRDNIFETLDQYEIHVPEDERTFPWFVCYDFEALLQKIQDRPTEALHWTAKHIPVSVSICSNVEGYTDPVCFVDPEQDELVRMMVGHMEEIAERVYELAEEKWGWVLEKIDEKINKDNIYEEEMEDDCTENDLELDEVPEGKTPSHPLQKVYRQLETYMSQVPVLGFNSAKYDLNLIKRCLAKHLNLHEETGTFVVKQNNAYTCIATDSLKFLDMTQFLAPGSSYAGFLKAYHVEEQKGFFPYEWFDDVTKLDATALPAHEDFYSELKASNISEEEYAFCQKVWRDQQMTTFRDFLVWYNNLDVRPFVDAVEKFQHFYDEKHLDVFKNAISTPGIARQLLFKTARDARASFALFDEYNKDLYQTVKQNIIGGPSIIFTRHHCVGETKIRGQKPCGAILGFDANALYLQAIRQPMPVGPFVRRLAENDFRPELRDKYMSAYYWMDWEAHNRGLSIQHRLNTGREFRVGKYPVDGYVPPAQPGDQATILQFHGCYWHGHLCDVTKGIRDEKWHATRASKYRKTRETTTYLQKEHRVIEMWECQFRQYCHQHPQIYDFIDSQRPGFFRHHKGKKTADAILDGVDSGELFGMVEVDIQVPDQWPPYFQHPTLSPYEYFEEMSPLFCTTEIPFDAIGGHMQAHIWEHQLSDHPRRLLVGGMKAQQILLATPLLRWYLNHGMIVTKIYQVVEYRQQRCFQDFVKEVSDARRQGDRDPNTAIIADTMKVIGNSGYGSLIMDQTKHRNVQYIQGERDTCLKVNDPLFTKLECLDQEDEMYEVEMAKRKINLDLPIQLGYFILQYAKLRMLEFYFNFMDKYVDRSDFEYCEMDTDSAYMAISGSSLEDVIKPWMMDQYQRGLKGFCKDSEIEADAGYHWFPRTCCSRHAKYDKRTPGLFKLEYQGDEMIGLCSKTYIVRKTKVICPSNTQMAARRLLNKARGRKTVVKRLQPRRSHEYKFSSKGVSKRHLRAPMTKFRRVLRTRKAEGGHNRGFRVRNNTVFTYTQERRGFSYLYCKRKVLDDGIHTVPLDLTLCPWPSRDQDVDDQELIDLLASNFED